MSAYFVVPGELQGALAEQIRVQFHVWVYFVGERGCESVPVFACTPDPARDVMHVRGNAWSMQVLCATMPDAR